MSPLTDIDFLLYHQVDRAHFAPYTPYTDSPQSIGHSATISAPHMHASAAESLLPYLHPSARILDVGSGSGYLTFVLAQLVGEQGRVVGVEHIPALAELGRRNVAKSETGSKALRDGRIEFVVGDGRLGWREDTQKSGSDSGAGSGKGEGEGSGQEDGGLWDAIHVGAAAKEAHEPLIQQLKRPGRLFIPVEDRDDGGGSQWIWVIDKSVDGKVSRRRDIGVRYVPLCDAPKS